MADDNFKLMVMDQRISRMRESLEALVKNPALSLDGNAAALRRILREDTELSLRRTGRTTRAIIAAAARAMNGERLAYVAPNHLLRDDVLRLLDEHAPTLTGMAERKGWSLLWPGGGSLEVRASAGNMRGSSTAVIYDHACEVAR